MYTLYDRDHKEKLIWFTYETREAAEEAMFELQAEKGGRYFIIRERH